MRRIVSVLWVAALMTGMVVASALPAFAEPPSHASNMGLCSSYLGQQRTPAGNDVRAEVNHLTRQFGYDNPGELFRVRAQQHVNGTPQQECVPRT